MHNELHLIESEQDAAAVLEYFNRFHDGFVRRVELLSHDSFEQDETGQSHICTGRFTVVLEIAHHNYDQGQQPHNRVVRLTLNDVRDFCFDLRGHNLCEWDIYDLDMQLDEDPDQALRLILTRSFLVGTCGWEQRRQTLLLFKSATIQEILST